MTNGGWMTTTIGDLCDFSSGYGFRPVDWAKEGLPIIRIQNLNGSQDFNYYNGQPRDEWLVERGTLLFAWAGSRGVSFGPTIWHGPRGVLNQHIYRVHPHDGVNPMWLYAALEIVTRNIERKAHGFKSTLVHVRKEEITGQIVDLPPLAEQQRIVDILADWDHAIGLTDQLIHAKQERKRALLQQLLTGALRLSAFQRQWAVTTLGQVFTTKHARNTGSKIRNPITVGKYAIRPQNEHFNRVVASDNLENYNVIEYGDFVYDPMSAYYGAFGRYELEEPGIVSPVYRVLRINSGYDSDFVKHLIKSHRITYQLSANSSQGNRQGKRRTIQEEAFDGISVAIPHIDEQRATARVLNACDSELALFERRLELLRQQKQGIMQQLLTGKVRVVA